MQGPGGNATDQYLLQRLSGASPEQVAALLIEGACRFLGQAIVAMDRRDIPAKTRCVNKVSAIIEELAVQLNPDEDNELCVNLTRLYDWWLHELFEGSQKNQRERLERIQRQMNEIRAGWEQTTQQPSPLNALQPATFGAEGLVG